MYTFDWLKNETDIAFSSRVLLKMSRKLLGEFLWIGILAKLDIDEGIPVIPPSSIIGLSIHYSL